MAAIEDILSELPDYCPNGFHPTPEELISLYLKDHIFGFESRQIQEETVYGEDINPWDKFCDPNNPYSWQTSSASTTASLYLFTKLSDVGMTEKSSSLQKNRKAGGGPWHGNSAPIKVKSFEDKDVVIGHYKVLNFQLPGGAETKGQWNMYEYSISGEAFPEILKVRGWQNQVVCWIKRDDTRSNVGGKVTKTDAAPKKPPLPKKGKEKPAPKKRKPSPPKAVPNKRRKRADEVEKAEFQQPTVVDNAEPARDDDCGELIDYDELGMDMDALLFDGVPGL